MQAAALKTSQRGCRCRGDLGQPGVGEGRLRYEMAHEGTRQNHCSFHHFKENIFHRRHQRAGSAAHLSPRPWQRAECPWGAVLPAWFWGVCLPPPPHPHPGYCWRLRGECGDTAPSSGPGAPTVPEVPSICCHPTAATALPPTSGRAAHKQQLFL